MSRPYQRASGPLIGAGAVLAEKFRGFRSARFNFFFVELDAQQCCDKLRHVPMSRRTIQRCLAVLIPGVDIRAFLDQQVDGFRVAEKRGRMQGPASILVPGVDIRAFLDQQVNGFRLTEKGRPTEGSYAEFTILGIDIRTIFQVPFDGTDVANSSGGPNIGVSIPGCCRFGILLNRGLNRLSADPVHCRHDRDQPQHARQEDTTKTLPNQ